MNLSLQVTAVALRRGLVSSFFCPKTFLKCFALEPNVFKTKQLRNVLGRVLGQKNYIQSRSFNFDHHTK